MRRVHLVVGVIVLVLLPLLSWLDGSGQLAWTMFSRTGQYRLEIRADGVQVNPTELAARAAPGPASSALAGADHFRHHDVTRATLRRHLDEVARLTCQVRHASRVVTRLEERVRTFEDLHITEVTVRCDR